MKLDYKKDGVPKLFNFCELSNGDLFIFVYDYNVKGKQIKDVDIYIKSSSGSKTAYSLKKYKDFNFDPYERVYLVDYENPIIKGLVR